MSKADEILERNRQRSRQRDQQRGKPETATDIFDRIMDGSMYLFIYGGMLILAFMLFVFSTFIGVGLFGGRLINALLFGLAVTVGVAYVLYKLGSRLDIF